MAPWPGMFQGGDTGRSDSRDEPAEEPRGEGGAKEKLLERENRTTPNGEGTVQEARRSLIASRRTPLRARCAAPDHP